MDSQDVTVITEYLKSLREEIHLRVAEHTRIVWIKLVSLGVVISFILDKTIGGKGMPASSTGGQPQQCFVLYFVWMVPLGAVIFDMMLASNLRAINNLGVYVRRYVEGMALAHVKGGIARDFQCSINASLIRSITKTRRAPSRTGFHESRNDGFLRKLQKLPRRLLTVMRLCRKPRLTPVDRGFERLRTALKDEGLELGKPAHLTLQDGKEWTIADGESTFLAVLIEDEARVYREFGFWESKAAQGATKFHCYQSADVIVIWLFTLASWLFAFFTLRLRSFCLTRWWQIDSGIAVVVGLFAGLALYCMWRALSMKRRF